MIAPALPAALAPPAPFPLVLSQTLTQEAIAPGVRRGRYDLVTSAGPLAVEIVAVDPRAPSIRFGSVIARDRLVSAGETISSMAQRTGAVAGVNADYFDIGQTNQPLNVVVRDGALLRSPSNRIALDVRRDGSIHFDNFAFGGSVAYETASVPLSTINQWPPEGGAGLITPEYGALRELAGVTVTRLVAEHPGDAAAGGAERYRAEATSAADAPAAGEIALAFGPAARALAAPPAPGDEVTIATQLEPALGDLLQAVGGGPLLVRASSPVDDPNAPAPEERDVRFPVAGAALQASGILLLVSVDGRQSATSVGVTRPEFGALMLGLGAADAMAFDSGGSATLVARVLGDLGPSVVNAPSDGEERPVADGFFVYSDAPVGPPAELVVRPSPVVALPGVDVPLRVAVVDAAGHGLGPAQPSGGDVIHAGTASQVVAVRAAGLTAQVPVRVVPQLARIDLSASVRRPEPGTAVAFEAVGKDARGATVALGDGVTWAADRGAFVKPGLYVAAQRDARITARAAGAEATFALRIGRHSVPLPLFDALHAASWQFASAPARGPGSLRIGADAVLELAYDFTASERAAYAATSFALPGEPFAFGIDVDGDGGGAGLRAAFVNVLGERRALTLAKRVDWRGWRTLALALPDDLNPPVRLVALYAVPSLGSAAALTAGTLRFRDPGVTIAGTP